MNVMSPISRRVIFRLVFARALVITVVPAVRMTAQAPADA